MFDFRRVCNVANLLSKRGGEEFNRFAISRYYYSLFGCARLYLLLVMGESEFANTGNIHKKLCWQLKSSDDLSENALGIILDELRELRNIADYDWEDNDSAFYEKRLNYVKKESKRGHEYLNALKKSPPFEL